MIGDKRGDLCFQALVDKLVDLFLLQRGEIMRLIVIILLFLVFEAISFVVLFAVGFFSIERRLLLEG